MENGKKSTREADASPITGNGKQPIQNQRNVVSDDYKTFDIPKAVQQDVRAAVSLLSLILDNPAILDLVCNEIEKIRSKIIEQESLPKKEDFHPEMQPAR